MACHGPWTVNASLEEIGTHLSYPMLSYLFRSASSPNVVSGVSGRKYSSKRQSDQRLLSSMRFAAPTAGCVHGKWKLEYNVVWHLTLLRQATELHTGNDMKNILYIWFSYFTLTETHRCQNYSLSLYLKKISLVDPFTCLLARNRNRL